MSNLIRTAIDRLKSIVLKSLIQAVDDSTKVQLVKATLLSDEDQDDIERIQEYGMTSNPPIDSEAVLLQCAGASDNLICVKVDSGAYRTLNLLTGEVCFYSQYGQTIKLDALGETIFNGGSRGVAREGHATQSNVTIDPAFFQFLTLVGTTLTTLSGVTHTPPTSLTCQISEGSSKVKIDD